VRKRVCVVCQGEFEMDNKQACCSSDCYDEFREGKTAWLPTLEEIAIAKAEIKAENFAAMRDRVPVAVVSEWDSEDEECL
jgi:hypothetical protein